MCVLFKMQEHVSVSQKDVEETRYESDGEVEETAVEDMKGDEKEDVQQSGEKDDKQDKQEKQIGEKDDEKDKQEKQIGENNEDDESEEDAGTDAGSGIDALDADLETWERIEDEYGVFQREPVEFIHYHFVYMGREEGGHYIRDVRSKVLELAEGVTQLESSVLMSLIKNNEIHSRRRYKVYRMLRYNVTATLAEVEAAVKAISRGKDMPPSADAATYISELEGFPTVAYQDTMIELEEHNALFIFMVEDVTVKGAHRRRSRGHPKGVRRATTRRAVTRVLA